MHNHTFNPIEAISAEVEATLTTQTIGMLRLKKANDTIVEAARRPNPRDLYHGLCTKVKSAASLPTPTSANPSTPYKWPTQ